MTHRRSVSARRWAPFWLAVAGVAAAIAAFVPILSGLPGGTRDNRPSSALASAPSGLYAVVSRSEEREDVILAAAAASPADLREIARVEHLPGFSSYGAVSPDRSKLALVVVDAGTPGRPGASLIVVGLTDGSVERRATAVDPLQTPTWAPDGSAIVVTRTAGPDGLADVHLASVPVHTGGETEVAVAPKALGAYPVGFGADGQLLYVVIGPDGSTLWRPGGKLVALSPFITRDWRLSPDGSALAYIETDVSHGLQYRQHVVSLTGSNAAAQVANDGGQHLGVAWGPKDAGPTFGDDPGSGRVSGQTTAGGFSIPLEYAPGGEVLAVQAWSGDSYADAGTMSLAVLSAGGAASIPGASRFFGWTRR